MNLEIKIFKTEDKLPMAGLNVMVNYEVSFQDYWTRAFHINGKWNVMSFNETKLLEMNEVKEWFYLPNYIT